MFILFYFFYWLEFLDKVLREDNTLLLFGRLDLESLENLDFGPKNKRKSSVEGHEFAQPLKKMKENSLPKQMTSTNWVTYNKLNIRSVN